MTVLRLVTDEPHSVRVPITEQELDDLEYLARNVLAPAIQATQELHAALRARDRDATVAACRRLLSAGHLAGERARQMEVE